jgi:hypothetical protein
MVPRGTPPLVGLLLWKKFMGSIGIEPVTFGLGENFGRAMLLARPRWLLLCIVAFN